MSLHSIKPANISRNTTIAETMGGTMTSTLTGAPVCKEFKIKGMLD